MIRRPSASSKLSGGNGSIRFIPLAQPQAGGLARDRVQDLAEIAVIEMLDFEKGGVFPRRLVGAEILDDAERRGAFERPEEAGAGRRRTGLRAPMREPRRMAEKAPGMRVIDPLKHEPLAQSRRHDVALLLDLLQSRGQRRVTKITVDVELIGRWLIGDLEAVGLQYRLIAEFAVEPGELLKEQPVGQAQIVFEIAEPIVAAEAAAQHLVAFEAEIHRLGIGADVVERAAFEIRHEMAVAGGAERDRDRRPEIGVGGVKAHPATPVGQALRLRERLLP